LQAPDEMKAMAKAGFANIERFATEKMIASYIEIYHQAINQSAT